VLRAVLRDVLKLRRETQPDADRPRVLNVGGYNKTIAMPPHFAGWKQVLLDIDPQSGADVVCDARDLQSRPAAQFDAVYCSHNLEHYFAHDVPKVLSGFHHVLKPDGFVELKVPDIQALMEHLVRYRMGLDDALYASPFGPVTALDVIYSFGKEIEESGNAFWAHKTGFSPNRLERAVKQAGFSSVFLTLSPEHVEVRALAFKQAPTPAQAALLALPGTTASP